MLALATEVEMVMQPCMMKPGTPKVSWLTLAADGSAVMARFTLRVWTLIEGAAPRGGRSWHNVTHLQDGVLVRIPIVRSGAKEWAETLRALSTLKLIVFTLQWQELEELTDGSHDQLAWIDYLETSFDHSGVSVTVSPVFAAFIRSADPSVFERVSVAMRRAEGVMTDDEHVPLTHGASKHYGALHLSVGRDCACLGVSASELPQSDQEGWQAHSHNIGTARQIVLVLVALAALEDEYRRVKLC